VLLGKPAVHLHELQLHSKPEPSLVGHTGVTDDVASTVAGVGATSDLFLALRYLVRAWRECTYNGNGNCGKVREAKFFTDFDYSFRMRRVVHLLEWARQEEMPVAVCDALILQLTRLLRKREPLSAPGPLNPVWRVIRRLSY
jgi:hypothetical protein